ncbi:hypothetical protein TSTA_064160 [Talaromyces stipitatus ATCC 10500]|uniref:Uncharacterized protein n=1 Tax=Talaromyces stipitatus (strain ATCC 10500 / CBS 375.48 / QM 6759 / NRRL 1006) TaxID=441959 RepID=B8LSV1_TALSN|nr:uncharacterized protein TSTA_064160 [Talaromyces stipitatus ATCC 10500]EED22947.1 hypothetical protein TSTA_064160 [Talaromyces stipitatus ATCC 10500]
MEPTNDATMEERPALDPTPGLGHPHDDIPPTSNETGSRPREHSEPVPQPQEDTVIEETPDADDEELVKVGLDDSGMGRMPKTGLPGTTLRLKENNKDRKGKVKGHERSCANDVEFSTLGRL